VRRIFGSLHGKKKKKFFLDPRPSDSDPLHRTSKSFADISVAMRVLKSFIAADLTIYLKRPGFK
jgi:hypothetical protein